MNLYRKIKEKYHYSTFRFVNFYFPHCAFSTLRIFHTPRFPHSAFSTLRIFHTPHIPHSAFSTLRVFHTPHFPLNLNKRTLNSYFGKFYWNFHTFILTSHSGFTYRLVNLVKWSTEILINCQAYANFKSQSVIANV